MKAFTNIIIMIFSTSLLFVESTDNSGRMGVRGGSGTKDRGGDGRRSFPSPGQTGYNHYNNQNPYFNQQIPYSDSYPDAYGQQYYPGQPSSGHQPYLGQYYSGQSSPNHYPFTQYHASQNLGSSTSNEHILSGTSSLSSGAFANTGSSSSFSAWNTYPFSPLLHCPKIEDLTIIETLTKSSVCSGNDEDSYEITSSSFDVCGEEQLLIQTCANSKIKTKVEAPSGSCTVNQANLFIPSATAEASIKLEDISFSCEGELAGLQKNGDDELAVLVSRHSEVEAQEGFEVDFCDSGACCKAGWEPFDGSCYIVPTIPEYLTWTQARDACQDIGGHLVIIQNQAENEFVADLIRETYPLRAEDASDDSATYTGRGAWIGLHRPFEGTGYYPGGGASFQLFGTGVPSDTFRWVDGIAGVYENFCGTNPSSLNLVLGVGGSSDSDEFCVDILGPHCVNDVLPSQPTRWNNKECDWPRHYVCETTPFFLPSSDIHEYQDSSCVNHILTVDKEIQQDCKLTWSFKTDCSETELCGSADVTLEKMALTATAVPLSTSTLNLLNH